MLCPCRSSAMPCRYGFRMCLSLSRSFLYDALKGCVIALTVLVRGYSPLLFTYRYFSLLVNPYPPFPVLTIRAIVRRLACSMSFRTVGRSQYPRRTVWRLEKGLVLELSTEQESCPLRSRETSLGVPEEEIGSDLAGPCLWGIGLGWWNRGCWPCCN